MKCDVQINPQSSFTKMEQFSKSHFDCQVQKEPRWPHLKPIRVRSSVMISQVRIVGVFLLKTVKDTKRTTKYHKKRISQIN